MSLDYASFPDSAGQELLQIHEREDNNGYDYNLEQKNKCSCLSAKGKSFI